MRSSVKGVLYWDFFPHMLIFLQKCISNHEAKQSSKFQSDPSPNYFTIDVWKINCWFQPFISYFLIVFVSISFYTSSVVFWYVIFWDNNLFKCEDESHDIPLTVITFKVSIFFSYLKVMTRQVEEIKMCMLQSVLY